MAETIENTELLGQIVKAWGVDAQVMVAIEEMAELTKALLKMRRRNYTWGSPILGNGKEWENLAEEVADVDLMLDQIKYMFEIYRTDERKLAKLNRIKDKLGLVT